MYQILGQTKDEVPASMPPLESALRYFSERAPAQLPPCLSTVSLGAGPLQTERIPLKLNGVPAFPGTANLRFCHLFDDNRLDLLFCEMRFGMVLALQPYLGFEKIKLLAKVPHPCHAEVVDLDQDGVRDILVANLGTVTPSDAKEGSVVWLRGARQGAFLPVPLATGLGRVADCEAADLDGDGHWDLIVSGSRWG